ncbi:MAG: hypothetical protein PHO01_03680 [Desulfotomaculaceae bacterium]|nr:hypothetical protein [Desulfotomaculaceae bacterium]
MHKCKWGFLVITFLVTGLLFGSIGVAYAAVSVTGTGQDEMVRAFEEMHQSVNNGNWYRTSTNDSGALAWSEAPVMYSFLRMYEATGDKTYLDQFIVHADSVLKTRDSVRGVKDYRGLSLPSWRAGGSYTLNGKYYIFAAHTAMIVSPMADFAGIVQRNNLTEYQTKANVYLQAAKEAVAVHNDEWVDNGNHGYYIIRKGAPVWSDGVGVPFNMNLIMGEALLNLYQATNESIYRERATKIARHFKDNLTLDPVTGAYVWNYWWGIAYTGWTTGNSPSVNTPSYKGYRVKEDVNHGVLDMRFVEKAYRAGIVFNETDMARFGKTISSKLIKTITSVALNVDGTGTADSPLRITSWTMLYPWAPGILDVDRQVKYVGPLGMCGLSLYCKALSVENDWNDGVTDPPGDGGTTEPGDEDDPTGNGGTTDPSGNEDDPPTGGQPSDPNDGGSTPPSVDPAQLIKNGDFSDGRTGWDVGKAGVIGVEASGNKYISNGYNWNLCQDLVLKPGKYVASAQTRKGSASTEARLVIMNLDAKGQTISANTVDIRHRHRGAGWESVPATEFTVPAGAAKTRVYLLVNGGSGVHHFDNISVKVKALTVEELLIKNGDFSDDRTSWDVGRAGVIGVEASGNKYISNGYNWNLCQDLVLKPGKYVASAQTRKGSASTEARLVIMSQDAKGQTISANTADIRHRHRGAGWESMPATEFTVPAGAAKTRVYLLINGGSGVHHFDNIFIKPVN